MKRAAIYARASTVETYLCDLRNRTGIGNVFEKN